VWKIKIIDYKKNIMLIQKIISIDCLSRFLQKLKELLIGKELYYNYTNINGGGYRFK
jgi:hypothetical protein